MGPQLIPLALAVASAVVQKKAADDAAERQKKVLAQEAATEEGYQKQATANAMEAADQYQPQTRAAAEQQVEQNAETSLGQALSQAQSPDGLPQSAQGRVSDAYLSAKAGSTAQELERAARLTQLMARMRAPTDLRTREGYALGDLAARNGSLNSDMRLAHDAYKTDAEQAGRPDSGLMMTAALLSAAGSAMGKGVGGTVGTAGLSDSGNMMAQAAKTPGGTPMVGNFDLMDNTG